MTLCLVGLKDFTSELQLLLLLLLLSLLLLCARTGHFLVFAVAQVQFWSADRLRSGKLKCIITMTTITTIIIIIIVIINILPNAVLIPLPLCLVITP